MVGEQGSLEAEWQVGAGLMSTCMLGSKEEAMGVVSQGWRPNVG